MTKVVFEGGLSEYSTSKFVFYIKNIKDNTPQKLDTKGDEKLVTIITIENNQICMHLKKAVFEYLWNLITEGIYSRRLEWE